MSLGTWLSEQIERRGWDVAQLARELDITWAHASRLVNDLPRKADGGFPERRVSTLQKIADSLNVPLDDVLNAALPAGTQHSTAQVSEIESILNDLNSDDAEEILLIARLKWKRLRSKGTPTGAADKNGFPVLELPPSRIQYDIEEHIFYTHDGKLADEETIHDVLRDIDSHRIIKDLHKLEQETKVVKP